MLLSQTHIRDVIASFDFSEGSGNTLIDKTGNGNDATLYGGIWTSDRFGRVNRAVTLDGIDDYIDLGLANYQGDIGVLISAKIISLSDNDILMQKNAYTSTLYNPSFRFAIRTSGNAINSLNRYDSVGNATAWGSNLSSAFTLDAWQMFYTSGKNGVGGCQGYGGRQNTLLNSQSNTNFVQGYPILVGREVGTARFSNIAIDRIMIFSKYKHGFELSKISNRIKIGDINK